MDTVIRIFRRNFTVYGRLRRDKARKRAVFPRNPPWSKNTERLRP